VRHFIVSEELLLHAVKALHSQAEVSAVLANSCAVTNTSEHSAAIMLEAIMKHPAAHPHVAKTYRPAHNI
jgi:hypothetical protein